MLFDPNKWFGLWDEWDPNIAWNRRRKTGLRREDLFLSLHTVKTQGYALYELNLDVRPQGDD
jgi:hypothetical protein